MERKPAEVFPPGEYLNDELEARGWTQTEFAEIIRRQPRVVNEIILGKRAITPETAREIAAALGTSPQLWLNLETAYQLGRTPQSETVELISREARLRENFPVREMIKRGWIQASENFEVLEKRVFEFFGISAVDDAPRLTHAARRNYQQSDLTDLQLAWLFRVKQLADAHKVAKYSEAKLRAAIPKLELLMTEPEEIRHVPKVLSDCGVRLIVVEPIPGSKIDGVCFWTDEAKAPIIGLTMKGDFIDRFWFNLRHECEHVLRGDGKDRIVIDDFESGQMDSQDEAEKAANKAAAQFCVPQASLMDFIVRHDPMYPTTSFIGFSRLMRRHPGIVAGQLQRKIRRPELFKKFQARVRHILIETALTDGYGRHAPVEI